MTKRKRTINSAPYVPPKIVPARLVRFTSLGDDSTVCLFDAEKNLLLIDTTLYNQLEPRDQTRVFRCRESIVITHKGNSARQQAAE
jgi:hypothetical protein